MPKISVIVVNYNGKPLLGDLFQSLSRQTLPADEVIMVDNASIDGSVDFVRQSYPWVRVIESAVNAGFAGGNNAGMATATGDFIALINSDTVAGEGWLSESMSIIASDDRIAVVVPKIYRADDHPILDSAGAQFNNLGHIWTRGFKEADEGQYEAVKEVAALTACAAVIRRDALGGEPLFDSDFFMYTEELDLSLRLRGRGHSIVYAPAAIIYHKGMASVKEVSSRPALFQQFHCTRNRMKILAKYYPAGLLLRNLPMIWLSLVYWDVVFLLWSGPRVLIRAIASQVRYCVRGLKERSRANASPALWLPWMTRHGLRDVLALRSARGESVFRSEYGRVFRSLWRRSDQV